MSGKRGFASLSPELRREYSRAGGLAVQEYGTAFGGKPSAGRPFTSDTARTAGAKGNAAQQARRSQQEGR